jgi:predicted DsbA family dithiol-disulfide isomerase
LLSSIDEIGLNRHECEEFLDSEEGIKEILRTVDIVHSLGIHSIPVLIINGGQAIVQGAAVADEVMDKLREVLNLFHYSVVLIFTMSLSQVINNPQSPGSLLFPRS